MALASDLNAKTLKRMLHCHNVNNLGHIVERYRLRREQGSRQHRQRRVLVAGHGDLARKRRAAFDNKAIQGSARWFGTGEKSHGGRYPELDRVSDLMVEIISIIDTKESGVTWPYDLDIR